MKNTNLTEQILNKIKIIADRLDSIEKTIQFINSEREILEDIRTSHVSLKELLLNQRQHFDNKIGDVKSEVTIQGIKTEDKLEETQEKVENTRNRIEEVKKAITQ